MNTCLGLLCATSAGKFGVSFQLQTEHVPEDDSAVLYTEHNVSDRSSSLSRDSWGDDLPDKFLTILLTDFMVQCRGVMERSAVAGRVDE